MSSLIFGAASSPFTAIYIKNRNAKDFEREFPEAAQAIIKDHYMDDYLGSVSDVDQAAKLAADIVEVHSRCGFEMRSWVSNKPEALRLVPESLRKSNSAVVDLDLEKSNMRVLGMTWNPCDDTFRFDITISPPSKKTKRQVLRDLMRVYDPLGMLQPLVTKGKILFQRTWRMVSSWDEPLPPSECVQWEAWYRDLESLKTLHIPRAYTYFTGHIGRELHIFSDASDAAYACVAYWRFLHSDNSVQVALISSKSRVTPLQPVSMPRLELQAALLGVRLARTICEEHHDKPIRRFFWCDSRTVLSWVRNDARCFKPFVAHRLGEIAEITHVEEWQWVPTALNVADDATRNKQSGNKALARWLVGPSFLLEPEGLWPKETKEPIPAEAKSELKPKESSGFVGHISVPNFLNFSSWQRLRRVTARVCQFVRVLKESRHPCLDDCRSWGTLRPLLARDYRTAENVLFRASQRDSFGEDLVKLSTGVPLSKGSCLRNLSPFIDEGGLLRARGRISAAEDVPIEREPPILDGRHYIIRLLIGYYHEWAAHGNRETVVNELRQRFYILNLRPSVRAVASRCRVCLLKKTAVTIPPTGDLPPERLQHHQRAFSYTGLDYFGPLEVTVKRSREKRYVALFTCLVTRAIHLELVGSLSADAALMALRRFIARRGCPKKILSDNGTAFVGANRLLREASVEINRSMQDFVASKGIEWSFLPPSSPSMAGVWERLVQSVKKALYATLNEKAPREETLRTLLAEAEQVVNSRPLTHVPVAAEDEPALTPMHFLIGSSSSLATPESCERDMLGRLEWKKAVKLADYFWSRWVNEYLPTLLPRGSGNSGSYVNLVPGDLVFIVDGNLPRGVWPRGRIVRTYPGKDNVVRVADVATAAGTLRRPARKLVKIDLSPS